MCPVEWALHTYTYINILLLLFYDVELFKKFRVKIAKCVFNSKLKKSKIDRAWQMVNQHHGQRSPTDNLST